MAKLEITVDDGVARRVLDFDHSPVRVGRDPASDVVVTWPWVSGDHGCFSFDEFAVSYSDLRSRNGSWIDSARGRRPAPAGEAVVLSAGESVCLSPGSGEAPTVVLRPRLQADAPAASRSPSAPQLGTFVMAAEEAKLYAAQSATAPGPESAPTPPRGLQAQRGAASASSHADPVAAPITPSRQLEALSTLCETLGTAILELRRTHVAVAEEVGVRAVGAQSGIAHVQSGSELLEYLAPAGQVAPDRLRELTDLLKALAVHEFALLSGIRQGVKALVDKLDPGAAFTEEEAARGGLRLFANRFDRYVEFFQTMTEDDGQSAVFGAEFAAAYGRAFSLPKR